MAPSRASIPPLLAGGGPHFLGGGGGGFVLLRPSFMSRNGVWEEGEGVRVRASLCLPSSAFSEDGGSGGPGGGLQMVGLDWGAG